MEGILLIAILIGLIPATIARKKGRSFFQWWVFGALMFIIALPAAIIVNDARRKCPSCLEPVNLEATTCKHCRNELKNLTPQEMDEMKKRDHVPAWISILAIIATCFLVYRCSFVTGL